MKQRKFQPNQKVKNVLPDGRVLVPDAVVIEYVSTCDGAGPELVRIVEAQHLQRGTIKQLIAWNKTFAVPEENLRAQ